MKSDIQEKPNGLRPRRVLKTGCTGMLEINAQEPVHVFGGNQAKFTSPPVRVGGRLAIYITGDAKKGDHEHACRAHLSSRD